MTICQNLYKALHRFAIHNIPPEELGNIGRKIIKYLPRNVVTPDPILSQEILGMQFSSPIGLAAGFDKDAECVGALSKLNFGFIELGSVLIREHDGNPMPRIFRLHEDKAVINKLGLPSAGVDVFQNNIDSQNINPNCRIGINITQHPNSENPLPEYASLFEKLHEHADYITINSSCPNTKSGIIKDTEYLNQILQIVDTKRKDLKPGLPVILKISPDIASDEEKSDLVNLALKNNIDGMIIGNTTKSRNGVVSHKKDREGGLSGKPLMAASTLLLKEIKKLAGDKLILIGTGGVFSAQDLLDKITHGASLVQIYTGFIYNGFNLIDDIHRELPVLLKNNGYQNIKEAVGMKA